MVNQHVVCLQKDTIRMCNKKCTFVVVSVEAKLSFVEPGRRWAHSPSPSRGPGIPYQGTTKTSVRTEDAKNLRKSLTAM